ncbi:cell division protein ZapE [Frigidibacter sp. MR17.14]|uniref:cell division protein ZapE n=1 Tax=Frigidibacter sp. MR17.14 TaxID=3126509 RepID=UPI00301300C9
MSQSQTADQTLAEIYEARVASGAIRGDDAQRRVLPELERVRRALEAPVPKKGLFGFLSKAPETPKGLYLWGGVGRGKSMLMDLFVESVGIEAKRRVHFHAFMQEIQTRLHEVRKTGVQDAIRPVAEAVAERARLLAFDEMQITDIADAMIVGRLFQYLYELGTVVVTTSNRVPEDLYKNGLNRPLFLPFIALIRERMEVRELSSDTDYRQDRLAGAQVYFHPANALADREMERVWDDLTNNGDDGPLRLEVMGRVVELPNHRARVARASFWDLCGKPLGPADYLAIAEAVDVLLLDHIPRLGSENFNAAKRFVTLIDALYEAKVRLVCSAADIPEHLYQEGEGSFEFERSASRLREMQGADWGADRAAPKT